MTFDGETHIFPQKTRMKTEMEHLDNVFAQHCRRICVETTDQNIALNVTIGLKSKCRQLISISLRNTRTSNAMIPLSSATYVSKTGRCHELLYKRRVFRCWNGAGDTCKKGVHPPRGAASKSGIPCRITRLSSYSITSAGCLNRNVLW